MFAFCLLRSSVLWYQALSELIGSSKPLFAAAVWERRRRIPSQTYNDPLDHIFTEFDSDGDGHLTAEEIATALQSRGVKATPDLVQEFIDAADTDGNGTVERNEWPNFIFHMANADLRTSSCSLDDAPR